MERREGQQRLDEIVLHAAALATSERPAYFAELADSEPDLLAEAQQLLAEAAALPTSFLAVPAGDLLATLSDSTEELPAVESNEEPPPLTPEERYEIQQMLGQGGMARVYRAWDKQLERQVALKFLDHPSPGMRRRLVREARAQARVQHRHVLEVYETGEREGTPYIAMRYVPGGTTLGDLGAEISLEQKARLVAQVADALHAAHRQGLLHRDVKPSNVLVEESEDQELVPWVTDFGIAVRDQGESSAGSELAGTPHFLPPERLSVGSDVDRRADVYSLGVTIYKLFTGELPYTATELIDVLQQIRTEDPRPPRAVMPSLPAELEAIVLKCLERDPADRYPSARAVADDLRRFLDGELVEAHAATLAHRLSKFAVRNRKLLSVAGIAAVLLVGVLVVFAVTTSLQARRIAREAETAARVSGFLTEVFEVSDPTEGLGEAISARQLLDRGVEKIDRELADQPEVQARLMTLMGRVYRRLGSFEAATPLLERALDIRLRVLGNRHEDVVESFSELGNLWDQRGDYEEAERYYQQALEISRSLHGPRHLQVALKLQDLGHLQRQRGRYDTAVSFLESALEIHAEWPEAETEKASALEALALTFQEQGELDSAEPLFRQTLEIYRGSFDQKHPNVSTAFNNLALVLHYQGDYKGAEPLYREAIASARLVFGDEHPEVATRLNNLAGVLLGIAAFDEAVALYREALSIREKAFGEEHPNVAVSLSNLGNALRSIAGHEEAEDLFRRSLIMKRKLLGDRHASVANTLVVWASNQLDLGDPAEAETLILEALEIYREVLPSGHWRIDRAESVLGSCLTHRGRFTEAEGYLLGSYRNLNEALGPEANYTQASLQRLTDLYEAWNRPEKARELLDSSQRQD